MNVPDLCPNLSIYLPGEFRTGENQLNSLRPTVRNRLGNDF